MRTKRLAEEVLLWRGRGHAHGLVRELRCTMEQLGEGFFELRLVSGRKLLLAEPFDDPRALLNRAQQLRIELHTPAV